MSGEPGRSAFRTRYAIPSRRSSFRMTHSDWVPSLRIPFIRREVARSVSTLGTIRNCPEFRIVKSDSDTIGIVQLLQMCFDGPNEAMGKTKTCRPCACQEAGSRPLGKRLCGEPKKILQWLSCSLRGPGSDGGRVAVFSETPRGTRPWLPFSKDGVHPGIVDPWCAKPASEPFRHVHGDCVAHEFPPGTCSRNTFCRFCPIYRESLQSFGITDVGLPDKTVWHEDRRR